MRFLFNQTYFDKPAAVISCRKLAEIPAAFAAMEQALADNLYLAGFLSYEAGYAFEECFRDNTTYDFPLVYFGAYAKPNSFSTHPPTCINSTLPPLLLREGGKRGVSYQTTLRQIKADLERGDTYQVNYTFKLKFDFSGDPFALFQRLKKKQPTPYSAYLAADDFHILSLSPELFFEKKGGKIKVKPMKGTIATGKDNRQRLRSDRKNQAENLMIVDLLRNDLGRIAEAGTVMTKKLFEIEKHPTLYQMTSTIEAQIEPAIPLNQLFCNLFPSGSVTGAPKISTMRIIRELEKEARKIYCGAIGYITPQRDMIFNVAIRTLLLTSYYLLPTTYSGELGIGSGITYDSDPAAEYEECLLKARFLLGGQLDRQDI